LTQRLLAVFALTLAMSRLTAVASVDFAPATPAPTAWADAVPRAEPILRTGNNSPYEVNGSRYEVLATGEGYRERGRASWYGMKFHGRPTSNGEIYDVYGATAAHRSLPIPSYVRVRNLENQRSVILRVNDRGPFADDRIIDVSYQASVALGFAEKGTAEVEVEVLSQEGVEDRRQQPAAAPRYLQIGAFSSWQTALDLARSLQRQWGQHCYVSPVDVDGRRLHRVRLGPFSGTDTLEWIRGQLLDHGFPEPLRLP
jgi:rare lipoprotein A